MPLHRNATTCQNLYWLIACLLAAVLSNQPAAAQSDVAQVGEPKTNDFRIETDVMEPGKGEPIDQSVTLFSGGVSYEYSQRSSNEITIIDPVEDRVIFLDTQRKIQTRVKLREIMAYIETARTQFAQTAGGTEKLADAAESGFDPSTQLVSAGKKFIRYEAKIQQPANMSIASYYAAFANASAVLNAWKARGNAPPPFARLQLNQVLREKSALPSEIKRTIFVGPSESSLISRIHVTYMLTESEKNRLEQFNEMIRNYSAVTLDEYRTPQTPRSR